MNPGSPEAIEAGCRCPVLDNGHGRGYLGDGERFGWWMSSDCPIHGKDSVSEAGNQPGLDERESG